MAADETHPADPARAGVKDRAELRALTSVRGLAAWFVVLYHIRFSVAELPPGLVTMFGKGYLAVDFFFLLSGFVIWLTWGERIRAGGWRVVPHFLQKRVARIWPLHLVMLSCAIGLALLLAATGREDPYHYPFAQLPLHVLLLQNWGFTSHLAWNDPSWSISAELGAYLLFPLLVLAVDWRRVPTLAILVAMGALFALLHMIMAGFGGATLGSEIARFGLLRCVTEFAAGTAICALWLRWRDAPALPAIAGGAVGIALLVCWATRLLPETLSVPAALAGLLLALALTSDRRGNPLEIAPLHYLGEISYATYLGHYLLFVVFKLAFVDDARVIPPTLIALYLAMVLGSSVALYHLIERPAQTWVNGLRLPSRKREGDLDFTPPPSPPQAPQSTPG
jgi:peptidoglycan/LPS O-acetylase OafA/YrhL